MKKILYGTLAILAASLMLSSCEKAFELERPNQQPWQNVQELELAVQSPYMYITERPWANALGMLPYRGFAESDMAFYIGQGGNSHHAAYANRLYNTYVLDQMIELEGAFLYLYYIPQQTNAALKLYTDAKEAGRDVDSEPFPNMSDSDRALARRYKGELLFMRAVANWYLVQTWCPPYNETTKAKAFITLKETYVNSADELKNAKLATVEQFYNSIEADLTKAIDLLTEEYPTEAGSARMRVNKSCARAMLARVLFYKGADDNKAKILSLLNDVVNSKMYSLDADPLAPFFTVGAQAGNETIWQICYAADNTDRFDRNPGIFSYYAYNNTSSYLSFYLSPMGMVKIGWLDLNTAMLTDLAKNKDKRFPALFHVATSSDVDAWTKIRPAVAKLAGVPDAALANPEIMPIVCLNKYFRGPDNASKNKGYRYANRPLIRYADVLLMRAQVNLLSSNTDAALKDINEVRTRAGVGTLGAVTEQDIEIEWIRENIGENASRLLWLVGMHKDIPCSETQTKVIKYPYENMYYQVPVAESLNNNAYHAN